MGQNISDEICKELSSRKQRKVGKTLFLRERPYNLFKNEVERLGFSISSTIDQLILKFLDGVQNSESSPEAAIRKSIKTL